MQVRGALLTVAAVGCLAVAARSANASAAGNRALELTSPLEPPGAGATGETVFRGLVAHSRLRDAALKQYSVLRTYKVSNDRGKAYAQEVVEMEFRAPGEKTFITESEQGSWLVRELVLHRLIASEQETARGKQHRDSSITPANYTFTLLGEQQVGPYHCYLVQAQPRRRDKYLFEGKVWINEQDFGIVRIAGQPAKKLSFWIKRADFVRQYVKLGEFWLPASDTTLVDVRFNGKKVLSILHENYTINGGRSASTSGAGGNSGR